MRKSTCFPAALIVLLFASSIFAADVFYSVHPGDLTITEGTLPAEGKSPDYRNWQVLQLMTPRAALDGAGEVYVTAGNPGASEVTLHIRAVDGQEVKGRLYVPKADRSGMAGVKFKLAAAAGKAQAKAEFLTAKHDYYQDLTDRNIPGAAWFRHQMDTANRDRGAQTADERQAGGTIRGSEMEETYNLFSGGRAVSENLQLDRVLPANSKPEAPTVDVDTLPGITVEAMDFKALLKDAKPAIDPLAAAIPADQHAIFFATFEAALAVADEANRTGWPILLLAEERAEDSKTKERYQRQLCLPMTGLGRIIGPTLIGSVAITGSDAYFRTGSDVAILMEPKDAGALHKLLNAQMAMQRQSYAAAKAVASEVQGVPYTGAVSPDRVISAYVAQIGDVVVVTNSLAQISRLAKVHDGKSPALATAPEYLFFRNRYPRRPRPPRQRGRGLGRA